MERRDIVIVGGGAAGMLAAVCAGKAGKRVLLLEGNAKVGKKLLATGNGRCNLTNLNIDACRYHGDMEKARLFFEEYPSERVLHEFEGLGLLCRSDGEGRVYPNSLQAAAVLQVLRDACEEAGVESRCGFEVGEICKTKEGFLIRSKDNEEAVGEKCILACGGTASPKHSCNTMGYRLAEGLGHSVTELSPSLVPLESSPKLLRPLKGMRCKAEASLWSNGRRIYGESGEVIFGEKALSGICIFNLSARARGLDPKNLEVRLDLLEHMEYSAILAYLRELCSAHPNREGSGIFSGVLNLRVGQELAKQAGIFHGTTLSQLSDKALESAARLAKGLRFPVSGLGGWDSAQVTAGGVPLAEIDIATMESKKQPGLYLVGELLNIDGDCGGYNLHWAWATAMAAGKAAAL